MDLTTFVTDILNGSSDASLDTISKAIKMRKQALREQSESLLKIQLAPGSKVRFVSSTRPKYLAGREATVVKINPKKVLVQVDASSDPWFDKGKMLGKKINTPLSLIELV